MIWNGVEWKLSEPPIKAHAYIIPIGRFGTVVDYNLSTDRYCIQTTKGNAGLWYKELDVELLHTFEWPDVEIALVNGNPMRRVRLSDDYKCN